MAGSGLTCKVKVEHYQLPVILLPYLAQAYPVVQFIDVYVGFSGVLMDNANVSITLVWGTFLCINNEYDTVYMQHEKNPFDLLIIS